MGYSVRKSNYVFGQHLSDVYFKRQNKVGLSPLQNFIDKDRYYALCLYTNSLDYEDCEYLIYDLMGNSLNGQDVQGWRDTTKKIIPYLSNIIQVHKFHGKITEPQSHEITSVSDLRDTYLSAYIYWLASAIQSYAHLIMQDGKSEEVDATSVYHQKQMSLSVLRLMTMSGELDELFGLSGILDELTKEFTACLLFRISIVNYLSSDINERLINAGYSKSFTQELGSVITKQIMAYYVTAPEWIVQANIDKTGCTTMQITLHPLTLEGVKDVNFVSGKIHANINQHVNPLISQHRMKNKKPILFRFTEL